MFNVLQIKSVKLEVQQWTDKFEKSDIKGEKPLFLGLEVSLTNFCVPSRAVLPI